MMSPRAITASTAVAPVGEPEANVLGQVTGIHSVQHRRSKLEARLLEADGAASVALDPISLFLVVTNNGTSDLQEHVWRLPRTVSRVRTLSQTTCGIDVDVDVDVDGADESAPKAVPRVLHLCFLSTAGRLSEKLQFEEGVVKRAGESKSEGTSPGSARRDIERLRAAKAFSAIVSDGGCLTKEGASFIRLDGARNVEAFRRLAEAPSPGAQLFALCGLQHLAAPEAAELRTKLSRSTAKSRVLLGCVVPPLSEVRQILRPSEGGTASPFDQACQILTQYDPSRVADTTCGRGLLDRGW